MERMLVEMSGLARDKVTKISFAIEVFGKERTMGEFLCFDVDAVELQKVENPETVKGWMPAQNRIIFSTTGYSIESPKHHCQCGKARRTVPVEGCRYAGHCLYRSPSKRKRPVLGVRDDRLSGLQDTRPLRHSGGDVTTLPFYIHQDVWRILPGVW